MTSEGAVETDPASFLVECARREAPLSFFPVAASGRCGWFPGVFSSAFIIQDLVPPSLMPMARKEKKTFDYTLAQECMKPYFLDLTAVFLFSVSMIFTSMLGNYTARDEIVAMCTPLQVLIVGWMVSMLFLIAASLERWRFNPLEMWLCVGALVYLATLLISEQYIPERLALFSLYLLTSLVVFGDSFVGEGGLFPSYVRWDKVTLHNITWIGYGGIVVGVLLIICGVCGVELLRSWWLHQQRRMVAQDEARLCAVWRDLISLPSTRAALGKLHLLVTHHRNNGDRLWGWKRMGEVVRRGSGDKGRGGGGGRVGPTPPPLHRRGGWTEGMGFKGEEEVRQRMMDDKEYNGNGAQFTLFATGGNEGRLVHCLDQLYFQVCMCVCMEVSMNVRVCVCLCVCIFSRMYVDLF